MSHLGQDLVARLERLTGQPAHPFLKRGIIFAHRDLHEYLDCYEKGQPLYLYTGRVRHSAMQAVRTSTLAQEAFVPGSRRPHTSVQSLSV